MGGGCMGRRVIEPESLPMSVQLSAATTVSLGGERYVHGYIPSTFGDGGGGDNRLHLVARSRAFSGFMLLLGKLRCALIGTHSLSHSH